MSSDTNYWQRRIGRRAAVRGVSAGALGVGALALVGCSSSSNNSNNTATKPPAPSAAASSSSSSASASTAAARAGGAAGTPTPLAISGGSATDPTTAKVLKAYPLNPPEPAGPIKKGGVLKVAAGFSLATFDPTKGAAGATLTPINCVYSRVVTFKTGPDYDPDHPEIVPDLAQKWEQPDPQTITFTLTPNVKFQNVAPLNGRPLTADDIKYAYGKYAAGGVNQGLVSDVDSVTVVDPNTVTFKLKSAFPDMLYRIASRYLTVFPHEIGDSANVDTTMVGTGPMMFSKADPGTGITFVKNPDYFGGAPNLDGFEIDFVPDPATLLGQFRAGQVGFSFGIPGASVDDANTLLDSVPNLLGMHGQPINGNMVLMLNLTNPKYKDPRVRQALALALNHDQIGQQAFTTYYFGSQIPWALVLDQPDSPKQMGKWFASSPTDAKALLAAAGQSNLEIDAIDSPQAGGFAKVDAITVDQLRAIGVTLKLNTMEYNAMNAQYVPGTYTDAVMEAWRPPTTAPSDAFEQLYKTGATNNRNHFSDPQVDALIDAQKAEPDANKAKAIRQQIRQKFLDDVWYIPHPVGVEFMALQPWVRNVRVSSLQAAVSYFYEWGPQLGRAWLNK